VKDGGFADVVGWLAEMTQWRGELRRARICALHRVRALAVPVDAAIALLQPVRVPGDLDVDQA